MHILSGESREKRQLLVFVRLLEVDFDVTTQRLEHGAATSQDMTVEPSGAQALALRVVGTRYDVT